MISRADASSPAEDVHASMHARTHAGGEGRGGGGAQRPSRAQPARVFASFADLEPPHQDLAEKLNFEFAFRGSRSSYRSYRDTTQGYPRMLFMNTSHERLAVASELASKLEERPRGDGERGMQAVGGREPRRRRCDRSPHPPERACCEEEVSARARTRVFAFCLLRPFN